MTEFSKMPLWRIETEVFLKKIKENEIKREIMRDFYLKISCWLFIRSKNTEKWSNDRVNLRCALRISSHIPGIFVIIENIKHRLLYNFFGKIGIILGYSCFKDIAVIGHRRECIYASRSGTDGSVPYKCGNPPNKRKNRTKRCHCEERSDVAISRYNLMVLTLWKLSENAEDPIFFGFMINRMYSRRLPRSQAPSQ